jgi:hypothetical protein
MLSIQTGQDRGWMETHKQAALSAIETSYKRDANYTISHTDELKEFKTKTCPYDCNGNGVCLENGRAKLYLNTNSFKKLKMLNKS